MHATVEELEAWIGQQIDLLEGERLLRSASIRITQATSNATYQVEDGLPVDPAVVSALRDATCAQAEWFMETGDRIGAGQAAPSQLGSLRFDAGSDNDGGVVCGEAGMILRNAGLITTTVGVRR